MTENKDVNVQDNIENGQPQEQDATTDVAEVPAEEKPGQPAGEHPELELAEDIETTLRKQVEQKEKEAIDSFQQLLRLRAEFDNYRKRVEKEKEHKFNIGKETVLIKVVDLVDIFDKALDSAKKTHNVKDTIHGLELLRKEFGTFLDKEGIKPIDCMGKKCDILFHEIIGTEETDDCAEDTVVKEVQKGYMFNNEDVIRSSKVIIAKPKKKKNKEEENKK
jgi:molecular chaperone GrpE